MRPCRRAQRGGRPRAAGVSRPCLVLQGNYSTTPLGKKLLPVERPSRSRMQIPFSIKIHTMNSPKFTPKASRPTRFVRFLPRHPAPAPVLKSDKTPALDRCVAGGVGGAVPDQREGRECIPPRSPDSPVHNSIPTAQACPTLPTAGLDIGKESPVCDPPARQIAHPEAPPAAFNTSRESWIWRPGLGIRK